MSTEICDRDNPNQQMKVNKDGSINTNQTAEGFSLTLYEAKQQESSELLGQVIKELKIMNLHLSILTDNTINNTEVE